MNDPITIGGIFTALITALSVMWKKLASDHARLEQRAAVLEEKDEKRDRDLAELEKAIAVFKACPANPCPAVEGLRRAESFPFQLKAAKP